MAPKQTTKLPSERDEKKLLEKIAKRYEQLDQKLDELEAKLVDLGFDANDRTFRPAKPR